MNICNGRERVAEHHMRENNIPITQKGQNHDNGILTPGWPVGTRTTPLASGFTPAVFLVVPIDFPSPMLDPRL